MIDYHYQTFLVLADTLDYAKTAQELCLSKPTITPAYPLSRNGFGSEIIPESGREFGADEEGPITEKPFSHHK